MERISISNLLLPISHRQFRDAVSEFKALAETSFGCECKVVIKAMSRIKWTSSFMHDDGTMEYMHQTNEAAVFAKVEDISSLTAEDFDRARYIEAVIAPVNESDGPNYAFAHLECKGLRPRQMTYYLQPGGENVMKTLRRNHRFQFVGDGYTHNAD